jgi:transcription elongation factor GreA
LGQGKFKGVLTDMKKQFHLTEDGVKQLKTELEALLANRGTVADSIRVAREQGDISENAEYQAAKQDQERKETRISELEHILMNYAVIKKPKGSDKVSHGSTVNLKSAAGKEKTFTIVGTVEADPLNGRISDESPIGKALLGKKQGEEVEIATPVETAIYKVASIA